jgi:membrane associated rhomboid family serine protease
VWTPGQQSIVLVLASLLAAWAGGQGALWIWEQFSDTPGQPTELWQLFRLDSDFTVSHHYWKIFTHALLHNDAVHFLANVGVLYLAGREVEPIIGRRHLLALSLTAWIVGGVVSWAAHIHGNTSENAEVAGFSAAAAAILAAYSTIMPELEQRLNVFFVIPLRFRAKFYALMVVSLATICIFSGTLTVIGPAGILAGSVLGWAWAKQLGFGNPLWIQRLIFDRRQRESRRERMNADDFVALEVDPILDKISREGLQSLSRAEWKILQQGSGKLGATDEPQKA